MSSNPKRLDILFKKYIDGTCSGSELNEFWLLMSQLTDEERLSIGFNESWKNTQLDKSDNNVKWDEIYDRLHRHINKTNKKSPLSIKHRYYYGAAAVIIGVIFMAYYLFFHTGHSTDSSLIVADVVKSAYKQGVRVITLPDSTIVTLRSGSQLQYDSLQFASTSERRIKVSGEAYFDVAHNVHRPFVVSAGNYEIKVLGTAFNVNVTGEKMEVTVTRGKVKVENSVNHKAVGVLTAGTQFAVDNDISKYEGKEPLKVNADSITQWVKQDLIFKNDTWKTAADIIKNKFGVDVQLANTNLSNCQFTADFTDKSLDECMDILCMLTNSKWEKLGISSIELTGEGCK